MTLNVSVASPSAKAMSPASRSELAKAPTLSISGGLLARLSVVSDSEIALTIGTGFCAGIDRPVLVPCVELSLEWSQIEDDEDAGDESVSRFSETITLENAAHMFARLASDLAEACSQLRMISAGGLTPEANRTLEARDMLEVARTALGESIADLEEVSAGPTNIVAEADKGTD